ncbi:hypothetical protein OBBRIDRAFT_839651 [Obba rivulosa]|uniref:Uncharacterized protein n=1 Tax=Obba rivulosa TaxID=1052685 RepID=A0A8E2AHD7_9APHY|nr:hypothetical protein OBBRIDRAFT_839651 [Obba rivulosa]
MDVDRENGKAKGKRLESEMPGELKIKGQANVERRNNKWDDERDEPMEDRAELEKRENELKEKALRNKVVRTRKSGSSTAPTS